MRLVSVPHRVHDTTRQPSSPSSTVPGVRGISRKVGRMAIGLLLRVGRAFRGTKQKLSQGSEGADACSPSQSPSVKKNISHTRGNWTSYW